MEKILKTNVYFNDTVFSDSIEQAIDADFSLPDYCPDISKIFKCQAVPRIASKSINGKTVTIDGVIELTILYCDKDEKFCSYDYKYPFSKILEINEEINNANILAKICTDYINCRAVNGRKVDIHGACMISVRVFRKKAVEIISDYDDVNIQLKRGNTPATIPMGYAEKYLLVEEEIRIGESKPQIENVLRYNCVSAVKETKIINGKAVIKGNLTVSVLYCPKEGNIPQCVKSVIPFSQILDIEGINDMCECESKSEVAFCEIKPKISPMGENKSFLINAKILISSKAHCSNDVAVLLDAFSRKYEAEICKNNICFDKISYNISEIFHTKKTIELDDDISSIVDLWSTTGLITTRFENTQMIITGIVTASGIYCNEQGNNIYFEKPIEFEYKYSLDSEPILPFCEPQISVESCSFTILSSNSIEVRFDLLINASVYERNNVSLISELKVNENRPLSKSNRGALTIYFPSKDECVWDIARIYNASVDEIMRINELENEDLIAGKMILVSVM